MLTFCFVEQGGLLEQAIQVLKELRTGLTTQDITAQFHRQRQEGYQLLAAFSHEGCVAVAGYRIAEKLAWGKHLYIDDLVTVAQIRQTGVGRQLLEQCITIAKQQGCQSVHLDSGVQRFAAHRFYYRHGMHISSHHFALSLSE